MGSTGGGAPTRRILHVDVDAMFVQCAVLADPERLAGESLIVVGGSPQGRGVVTSASYGCRAFGVRSAMPMATALRLCPRAVVVRVPGEMIRRQSRELAGVLGTLGFTGVLVYFGVRMVTVFTDRAARRGGPGPEILAEIDDLRMRVGELEADRTRLVEVEERLDFAERLLTAGAQPAPMPEGRRET